jgi:hypothetical protein
MTSRRKRNNISHPRKLLRDFMVDAEDVIRSSLAMILRFQAGFYAASFTHPLMALQAAHMEDPDFLISDAPSRGAKAWTLSRG